MGGGHDELPVVQERYQIAECLPASHQRHLESTQTAFEQKWLRRGSTALRGLNTLRCRADWREALVQSSSVAKEQLKSLVSPQGPGTCDHNAAERAINIVTSLPFFALGLQAYRQATSAESKLYGASVMGVGAGAIAFHASSGPARHWGRKLDYWVIALSTAALTRVLHPDVSPHRTGASLLLTPMQPLAVTSANTVGMEVEFWKRARQNPELRRAHQLHVASAAAGAACFVVEDLHPALPWIHSVWHTLSAVALHTTNALVRDADRRRAQSGGGGAP